jgi:hypothetical protein
MTTSGQSCGASISGSSNVLTRYSQSIYGIEQHGGVVYGSAIQSQDEYECRAHSMGGNEPLARAAARQRLANHEAWLAEQEISIANNHHHWNGSNSISHSQSAYSNEASLVTLMSQSSIEQVLFTPSDAECELTFLQTQSPYVLTVQVDDPLASSQAVHPYEKDALLTPGIVSKSTVLIIVAE